MKIALLSSWGIRCGVSDYAVDLARAWQYQGHEVGIFCERSLDGMTEDPPDLPAPDRYFLRTMYTAEEIVEPILEWGPELVSIEHEFGVWPNDRAFIDALRLLRRYTKTIVTLHTVPRWPYHRRFFGEIEGPVIVHHPGAVVAMRDWVGWYSVPEDKPYCDLHVVPHGLSPSTPGTRDVDGPLEPVFMPGFISASKGHLEVLEAMNHSEGWNLEIAGAPDGLYLDDLVERVSSLGLSDRVKIVPQFLDRKELRARLATAQVVLLNTTSDNYSASGQAADCVSAGAMTVSRAMPIYDMLNGIGFKFGIGADPPADEIGRTILTAATSVHTEEEVETMKLMCRHRSWDAVARERLKIVGLA